MRLLTRQRCSPLSVVEASLRCQFREKAMAAITATLAVSVEFPANQSPRMLTPRHRYHPQVPRHRG